MPSSSSTTSTVVGGLCGSGLGMALTYVPSTTRASRAMLRAPMASSAPASLTAVRGISVGHWTDLERATGCSVVIGPESGMPAACVVGGRAPGGKADRWPTADDAYRACTAASADVVEGSVGAGTGATVGKALGPRAAMKGGVGSWAASGGDIVVGALVVLNAVGNILDGAGA